uniref:Plasminogen receptor (KT) n=1 Tax=Angiostrongylus cantonensis TaxID=6313 RepID=A0A0K0DE02_ANGCA
MGFVYMGQSISHQKVRHQKAELTALNDDFIEAEIVLKNLEFAQERAVKLIELRERFSWEFAGITTMVCILFFSGSVTKRKEFVIPIAPLIMGLGYRYYCAYGVNSGNVIESAEALLKGNDDSLKMVGGPLTLKEVDAYRAKHF